MVTPPPPPLVSLGPVADLVVPAELEVAASAVTLAVGDRLARLEVEIWRVDADGTARERAWVGVATDAARRSLRLADGTLEGAAALIGELEPWQLHLVRARDVVTSVDGCVVEGPWSAKRTFRTDDGSAALFDPATVRDYRVDLPPDSYAAIDAEAEPPGCVPFERSYHAGTLRFEGRSFAEVGVKAKGGCGSARTLDRKTALKLHLGWDGPTPGCPAERRLRGLERLTLNNMVQDRSMSHELMAYELYRRMGVPVPRATYARVHVNDVFYGLYLHVETVDRRFLARNFVSNRGQLYEGTYHCDLIAGNVRDDDSGCLRRTFDLDACDGAPEPDDDPDDYTPLRALIARLDALPASGVLPALALTFDVDALFGMWAVDALIAHWDGHVYDLVNNYRVYHDPGTDRWTVIPSGVDQTFGESHLDDDPWSVTARVAQRCLADPACEAAFAVRLRQAVELFTALDLTARRQALQATVQALVVPDAGREFDLNAFRERHAETQRFIDARAGRILQALSSRGL